MLLSFKSKVLSHRKMKMGIAATTFLVLLFFIIVVSCYAVSSASNFLQHEPIDSIDNGIRFEYNELNETHLSIEQFLDQTGLTFSEYIDMMNQLFEAGEYPHYISANSERYRDFSEREPEISYETIIAFVNAGLDLEPYKQVADTLDPYCFKVLVNKSFNLPLGWEPDDMISIGNSHMLREYAAGYFEKLRDAMREEGLRLVVISSFRSFSSQRGIHSRGVSRVGLASADRQFARAGHSEHQTGLALDILQRSGDRLLSQAQFQNTIEFEWLLENAHKFGFILRYPQAYTHLHGYIFEPWHWRFIGVDAATVMFEHNITVFEEFYGRFLASEVLMSVREDILDGQMSSDDEYEHLNEKDKDKEEYTENEDLNDEWILLEIEDSPMLIEEATVSDASIDGEGKDRVTTIEEGSALLVIFIVALIALPLLGIAGVVVVRS